MNSKDMVKQVLLEVFENYAWDDGVDRTAERIIAAWKEFVPPMQPDFDFTTFPATANQMIVVKDIEFSSLCAHHLFPYTGRAHVGYLPNDLMVGVSKIPRLVRYFATRPTTQEWLTAQIASTMKHKLQAMGVAVVVEP